LILASVAYFAYNYYLYKKSGVKIIKWKALGLFFRGKKLWMKI
jgi:hypothetical protein